MKIGLLFQPGALWIGAHYSTYDRRWCINLLPCLTVWVTLRDGREPRCVAYKRLARADRQH